jgi:hypothetical protein
MQDPSPQVHRGARLGRIKRLGLQVLKLPALLSDLPRLGMLVHHDLGYAGNLRVEIEALRKALGEGEAKRQELKAGAIWAWNIAMEYVHQNKVLCRELFGPPNPTVTPPREIPEELLDGYTMGGLVEIEDVYQDGTYPDNWPLIYTDEEVNKHLERIDRGEWFIYGMTDSWVCEALAKYPIAGLEVVNMGSLTPWYESMCLYYGGKPTTIDYNKIITRTDRLKTMTVSEWERDRPSFDVALSISSFEHDGLGMYGDPVDPDADLKAMKKMK